MKPAPRALLIAATTLALVATAPTTASAQNVIPGDLNAGKVVITWLAGVDVSVTQPNASEVEVKVTNTSGRNLVCNGPAGNTGIGATATPARVAQAAVQYYANFAHKPDPINRFGSTGDLGATDGDLTADITWGPILGFLPTGSIAPFLGDAYAARDWISRNHTAGITAGHAGTTNSITVNNNNTANPATRTIYLGPPTNGPRTNFDAGVFLVCTSGDDTFAFAGYENGPPSPTNAGTLPIGSTGNR